MSVVKKLLRNSSNKNIDKTVFPAAIKTTVGGVALHLGGKIF